MAVEKNFVVYNPVSTPELNANIRMEVGFSNLIHLEYELFQSKYNLDECIVGKVYFVSVMMKVKTVEIHLVKNETIGSGLNKKSDIELISKFELIDGNPAAGELAPIRMFINSFETLSPTYRELNNTVSVKYYLKFVVIDDEDRSFYKQQEITLWRKCIN